MTMIIRNREFASHVRAEREATDASQFDEVWDGVYVVSPTPNNEHQFLAAELWLVFRSVIDSAGRGRSFNRINVSDRQEGWTHNYREPDVAVFLQGGQARDYGTHWCGGPDFAVEILSEDDMAREKRPFYARVGVHELLIIDRDPWALELYRLDAGELTLVGQSSLDQPDLLDSEVLPLGFRLVDGPERPQIEVNGTAQPERWVI